MTLGQRIQAHRTRLGLSQEGLGDKLGVSRQAVSKWEADGAVPDTDKLIALSKLFGITLNELLQVEEPEQPKRPVPVRRSRERMVVTAVLIAALAGLAGTNLWLAARVGALEGQIAALQNQDQPLDPKAMVAGWDFKVVNDNEAGRAIEFQVTTARYDPAEDLEVFFLLSGKNLASERKQAGMKSHASGIYTATINLDARQFTDFTLSVGFVKDGVECIQPLAEFDSLTYDGSSYTSLWP